MRKLSILIASLLTIFILLGCAKIHGSKTTTDANGIVVRDEIRITTVFSKSTLNKFKGNYSTGKTSALVSFDSADSSAQLEEMGAAFGAGFGAAATTVMEKMVKKP